MFYDVQEDLDSLRIKDLIVNGHLVEVKTDIIASKTGNVCIEHQSLKTHTAPWYIWVIPQFYRVSKKQLEHLVASWPDVVDIGDDKRKGTLIKINSETFKENFTKI